MEQGQGLRPYPDRGLPPFPNGWFRVCDTDQLERGEVKAVHYFGRELVLFRGEDGAARVLDAYCVHLGAHLGVGGVVEGNSIRCPFHAWRYDGSGACIEVPYAKRIPDRAKLHAWQVCERNGAIMVWHHAGGEPPGWEVPVIAEWGSDEWTKPERRHFKVKAHPLEMAENICDPAHFHYVHGTPDIPPTEAESDGHVFRVKQGLTFTTPRGEVEGRVEVECHGLGFGRTRFSGLLETLVVITGAPVDEEYGETTLRFMIKKLGNEDAERGVIGAFIDEIERQFSQDIPIWENKIHLERPVLCDGDGPIAALRRWSKQFYSEGGG